ncbi:MAG: hypothetical protein ACH350_00720 [Parachlamydiaceae bacterium]
MTRFYTGGLMGRDIISNESKEKMFYFLIKNEIEEMIDVKLHSLYQKNPVETINVKKIEEECKNQFFDQLGEILEKSVKACTEFYEVLKLDDPDLFDSLQGEFKAIARNVATCRSIHDLTQLKHLSFSEKDENIIYAMGLKHFKEEQLDKAYLYFSFLTLIDAENAHIWLARGMVEQNLGRYQEALSSYSSSASLAPENLIVYFQIIDTLLLMKHHDEAKRVYETFMQEVDPELYSHHSLMISKLEKVRSYLNQSASTAVIV